MVLVAKLCFECKLQNPGLLMWCWFALQRRTEENFLSRENSKSTVFNEPVNFTHHNRDAHLLFTVGPRDSMGRKTVIFTQSNIRSPRLRQRTHGIHLDVEFSCLLLHRMPASLSQSLNTFFTGTDVQILLLWHNELDTFVISLSLRGSLAYFH